VARGFLGATNLAVSPDGDIYVAEIFAGRIWHVVDGEPHTVVELPFPAAVEFPRVELYAGSTRSASLQRKAGRW
jgi:hypothetical protein